MKKIILVAGVMGSGKDSFAHWYKDAYDLRAVEGERERCHIMYFGDGLVQLLAAMRKLKMDMRKGTKRYEWWRRFRKVRWQLQTVGDAVRRAYGADFFARRTKEEMLELWDEYDTFIISDFRYPAEFEVMLELDAKVYVTLKNFYSDRYTNEDEHKSEKMAQWMLNNGVPTDMMIPSEDFVPILERLKEELCLY